MATEEEVRRLFSPFPPVDVPGVFAEMQVSAAVRRAHQQGLDLLVGDVDDAGVPDGSDAEALTREMEALLSLGSGAAPPQDGAAGAEVPVRWGARGPLSAWACLIGPGRV